MDFSRVFKFNENHDPTSGEFSGDGGGAATSSAVDDKSYKDIGARTASGRKAFQVDQASQFRGVLGPAKQAIRDYTGDDYTAVNAYMRNGSGKLTASQKEDITPLKNVLNTMKINQDIVTYRGLDVSRLNVQVGDVITDKAFISTSLKSDVADRAAAGSTDGGIMKVSVPKGTHGAYVSAYTQHPDEDEVLLAPNTKFLVKRISTYKKRKQVEVTVVT